MEKEFLELYKATKIEIENNNNELIKKIRNNPTLDSVECLSIHFSSCLCEDIEFVLELMEKNYSDRYVYSVIRNICEQIIEYKYLCKHNKYIKEYYGDKIHDKYLKKTTDVKKLKALMGDDRYSIKRNIREWAKDLDEDNESDSDVNDDMSLYTIYQLSSTEYHQSYFNEIVDLISEVEKEQEDDRELVFIMLIFLLMKFMDSYNNCVNC